jgi:hypothetical protein
MNTIEIKIDKVKAKELYRAYLTHQHYEQPVDEEIKRAYRLISQGRMIIQALESIKLAGVGDDGFPKLAIARADSKTQRVTVRTDGSAMMAPWIWGRSRRRPTTGERAVEFEWPSDTFPRPSAANRNAAGEATVPMIPLPMRPRRSLESYHILWEANWRRMIAEDPLLLRRLGKGDLWLVLGQWDLTPVERAALATRVNAA